MDQSSENTKSSRYGRPHCPRKPSRPHLILGLAGLLSLAFTCFAQLQANIASPPDAGGNAAMTNASDTNGFAD
jgi:hypothetical protein